MDALLIFSVLLEAVVAILGLLIWIQKKQQYGLCIFIAFIIYIVYDTAWRWPLGISAGMLRVLFAIGCISILWGVWEIYKKVK